MNNDPKKDDDKSGLNDNTNPNRRLAEPIEDLVEDGFLLWARVPVGNNLGLVWGTTWQKVGVDIVIFQANETFASGTNTVRDGHVTSRKYYVTDYMWKEDQDNILSHTSMHESRKDESKSGDFVEFYTFRPKAPHAKGSEITSDDGSQISTT